MIDAGLQYVRTFQARGLVGWEAVILNSQENHGFNGGMVSAKTWDPGTSAMEIWLGAPQHFNTSLLFQIHDGGGVSLTVDAFSSFTSKTFYWNPAPFADPSADPGVPYPSTGVQIFDPDHFQTTAVKRVIGMTQAKPYRGALDGSTLTCTFSNGRVSRRFVDNSGRTALSQSDWDGSDPIEVDQSQTGYDAPGNTTDTGRRNYDAWDKVVRRPRGRQLARSRADNRIVSRYKVNFPGLQGVTPAVARTDVAASREATQASVSRYQHETVDIYLRQVAAAREK